jgi:hypothetical protein
MFGLTGALPYVVAAIIALGAFGGTYLKGRWDGAASRNPEIVQYQVAIAQHERIALEAQERANKASASVVVKWRERVKTIEVEKEAAPRLIEVIRDKTPADCVLPAEYRRLWNGSKNAPDGTAAQDSARANDAPVAVADAARAAAEARQAFEVNKAKLEAIQSYLSKIQEAS